MVKSTVPAQINVHRILLIKTFGACFIIDNPAQSL
jgi:hypothetical protein